MTKLFHSSQKKSHYQILSEHWSHQKLSMRWYCTAFMSIQTQIKCFAWKPTNTDEITLSVHISHWLFNRPDGCDELPLSLMQCQVTSQESVKVLRCTLEVGHHTPWGLMLTCLELLDIILAGTWAGNSSCEWDLCHDASMFENGGWCCDSFECEWERLEGWSLSGWTWLYFCVVYIFLLVGTDQWWGWGMVIDFVYVHVCMPACSGWLWSDSSMSSSGCRVCCRGDLIFRHSERMTAERACERLVLRHSLAQSVTA